MHPLFSLWVFDTPYIFHLGLCSLNLFLGLRHSNLFGFTICYLFGITTRHLFILHTCYPLSVFMHPVYIIELCYSDTCLVLHVWACAPSFRVWVCTPTISIWLCTPPPFLSFIWFLYTPYPLLTPIFALEFVHPLFFVWVVVRCVLNWFFYIPLSLFESAHP
jgi:hypothetical protein